jgi:hypothetical protein
MTPYWAGYTTGLFGGAAGILLADGHTIRAALCFGSFTLGHYTA